LPMTFELFSELMHNLKLDNEEFQRERQVVAEERLLRTDSNPMGYLYFRLFNTHYVYHPYRWLPIGFMQDIQRWSIDDLKEFYQTYYQPNNAILMVTGDVNPDEVFKNAQKAFENITNAVREVPKVKFIEPEQDGAKHITIHRDTEVEMLAITFHIPNFKHKDQVTLSMISEILFSGKSSRLYKELVDKQRLVNSIYAYNMENIDPGLFIFLASCNPNVKAEDVEIELIKQIELIKSQEVTKAEIQKVKINTKADFIYSLESSTSVANLFGSYLVRGDLNPLLSYEEDINKVSAKQVQEIAKKYFDFSKSTTLILKK